MKRERLILASASPRRKDLLSPFFKLLIRPSEIDESVEKNESARAYVRRMARSKWQVMAKKFSAELVLAADTIVVLKNRIIGKAKNAKEAGLILNQLSGKTHEVITGVCLGSARKRRKIFLVSTKISFRKLSKKEIEAYIQSGEWKSKAGAYGIQGRASVFVSEIRGSLTNVIGLPLERVLKEIQSLR
jgi:septum formation protein